MYLVPAAVSSVAGLRVHVSAYDRRRGRGDGDVRYGRRGLSRDGHSRTILTFNELLWIFISKMQMIKNNLGGFLDLGSEAFPKLSFNF